MSAAKMVADSTQGDLDEPQLKKRKRKKESVKKKSKKLKKRVSKRDKGSKKEDEDSDLDLDRPLLPLADYIKGRQEMNEQLFHCLRGPSLQRYIPDVLKELSLEELKRRCLEHLEIMSKKRIRRILSGDDPASISSSGTEEESSAEECEQEENNGEKEPEDVDVHKTELHGDNSENEDQEQDKSDFEDIETDRESDMEEGNDSSLERKKGEQSDLEEGETLTDEDEESLDRSDGDQGGSDDSDGEIKSDESNIGDHSSDESSRDRVKDMDSDSQADLTEIEDKANSGSAVKITKIEVMDNDTDINKGSQTSRSYSSESEDEGQGAVSSEKGSNSPRQLDEMDENESHAENSSLDVRLPNQHKVGKLSLNEIPSVTKTDVSCENETIEQIINTKAPHDDDDYDDRLSSNVDDNSVNSQADSDNIEDITEALSDSLDTPQGECIESIKMDRSCNSPTDDDISKLRQEAIKSVKTDIRIIEIKNPSKLGSDEIGYRLMDGNEQNENESSKSQVKLVKSVASSKLNIQPSKVEQSKKSDIKQGSSSNTGFVSKQTVLGKILLEKPISKQASEVCSLNRESKTSVDSFSKPSSSKNESSFTEVSGNSSAMLVSDISLWKEMTKVSSSSKVMTKSSSSTKEMTKSSSSSKVMPKSLSWSNLSSGSSKVMTKSSSSSNLSSGSSKVMTKSSSSSSKIETTKTSPETASTGSEHSQGALAPVLTKNQMELLELEMRARAIKAMLAAHEKKGKK